MSKEKTLLKNTAIVTIGKICTQMISFFLLPLYTAMLSTEEYGVVDLLNTLINLIVPILLIQIDQGVFRFLIDVRGNKDKEDELISISWFFTVAQVVIYLIFFALAYPFIHNEYKLFLGTNLIFALGSTLLLQVARGVGDNVSYTFASFISGSATVLLNVIFIVGFHLGAYGMLLASMIANLLACIYIFVKLKLHQRIKFKLFNKQLLKEMVAYSLPLVPNVISWWIVSSSSRVLITMFLGLGANGVYSAANKFSGVLVMIYGVFNLTWTESAAINIDGEDKNEFFSKIFEMIIRIFGAICLNVIALMPFVFPFMINEKFSAAYEQIPILILATVFNIFIQFLGSVYVAKKLAKEIAKTSILAAIINIVVNVALIQFVGLYAASISTLVAYFALFVYRYIDSKRLVTLKVPSNLVISMILVYVLVFIGYYMNTPIINIAIALLAVVYAIIINLKNISAILMMFKSKLKKA